MIGQMVLLVVHSLTQTCVAVVCLKVGHDLARWYYREFRGINVNEGTGRHGREGH
jgi:hypothetical protein